MEMLTGLIEKMNLQRHDYRKAIQVILESDIEYKKEIAEELGDKALYVDNEIMDLEKLEDLANIKYNYEKIAFITDKEYLDDILPDVIEKGTFILEYLIRDRGCGDKKIKFDEQSIRSYLALHVYGRYKLFLSRNVKQPEHLEYGVWKNLEIKNDRTETTISDGRYCFSSKTVYFYLIEGNEKKTEKVGKETKSKIENLSGDFVDIGKDLEEEEKEPQVGNCNYAECGQVVYIGRKCIKHYHYGCLHYHDESRGFCGESRNYGMLCTEHHALHNFKYEQGRCCWKGCNENVSQSSMGVNYVYCDEHNKHLEQLKLKKAMSKIMISIFGFAFPDILNLVDETFGNDKPLFEGFEEKQYQKFLDVFSQFKYNSDNSGGRGIKRTMEGREFSLPIFSSLIDRKNGEVIKELERLATL